MQNKQELVSALNEIRAAIDADVIDLGIEVVNNKLIKLTQLSGLSAETKATAKKLLGLKELEVLKSIDKELPPSVQIRILNAECFDENALLDYADRLNSALTHTQSGLITSISLYKEEMKQGLIIK